MDSVFIQAAQLGGTVFTTVAFLWYLMKTSEKQVQSQVTLARSLQRLTDMIKRSIDQSTANTSQLGKNENALKDNTTKVEENTGIIHKTNGNGKH